jgi:hypothetical protein
MSSCREIKYCALEMLKQNNINVKPSDRNKVIVLLSEYIDCLIFNIVAVTCVICLNMNMKKVLHEHVNYYSRYIAKRCGSLSAITKPSKSMRGGAFNTAAFYGIQESQYKAENAGGNIMNIDWANNIARPRLDSTMTLMIGGGKYCSKLNKLLSKKIYHVFKHFKVTAKKGVRQIFLSIFKKYMDKLFKQIPKSKEVSYGQVKILVAKCKIMKK